MPTNGLWLRRGEPPVLVVRGAQMSRDATNVKKGNQAKALALPRTARVVQKRAFASEKRTRSVRLDEALETLESECFAGSGLRRLALSSGSGRSGSARSRGARA